MSELRKSKTSAKETTLPGRTPSIKGTPPAKIPKMIGRYEIEGFFAKGGMSHLYLAKDPESHTPVVIKTLDPQFIHHPELTEHFLQEAKIIQKTSHPNIVKLLGYGRWDEGLYLVMELIQGVSLVQFIREKTLSSQRCLEITLQVASALSHLHEHGIIHRDIKPENILITEEGEVKVIDFGVAQLRNGKSIPSLKGKIGTISYMSPEQKEDPSSVTFASDLYSLGIVLYELITGKISHGFVDVQYLPQFLQPLFSKLIADDPKERYRNALELIKDLSHILENNLQFLEKEKGWQGLQIAYEKKARFFFPKEKPHWAGLELDFALLGDEKMGIAMQFFSLTPYTDALLLLKTKDHNPFSSLELSYVLSLFDAHVKAFSQKGPKAVFHSSEFLQPIQEMTCAKEIEIVMGFLVLDIHADMLAWTSCNLGELVLHSPDSGKIATLSSVNQDLGTPGLELDTVHESFPTGAQLFLTTFEQGELKEVFQKSLSLDVTARKELLEEKSALSPTSLSHAEVMVLIDRIT